MLGADVVTWPDGDRVVLWHRVTGRSVALAAETLARLAEPRLEPVRLRLRRLHMLDEALDLAALVPVRSRMVLLLPERPALWAPVAERHTAGGHAYRALDLTAEQLSLWRLIDDRSTVSDLAAAAELGTRQTLQALSAWTRPDTQALQLRDEPLRRPDPTLTRVVGVPRADNERSDDQRGEHGQTTLTEYHLHGITDGATHFDDRETTVAHAHAVAHPMLAGRSYGEALFDSLSAQGLVRPGARIAEVGCGTGELARAFWSRAAPTCGAYWRLDLSPELLRTQALNAPGTVGVLADAVALPLADASVDLVLNNEVIADLEAAPISAPGVAERIERYGLERLPDGSLYNLGAWRFVEQIAAALRGGGAAFLSEFGSEADAPAEATQLDHPEVSIHFGHIAAVGNALGLEARIVRLERLLDADMSALHLARPSYIALRALCRSRGVHLAARAWTAQSVAAQLPEKVEGLWDVPVADPGPGPLITRFLAVLFMKPPR